MSELLDCLRENVAAAENRNQWMRATRALNLALAMQAADVV